MDSRCVQVLQADEGLRRSGVPLVAYDGEHWLPVGSPDDIGNLLLCPAVKPDSAHPAWGPSVDPFFSPAFLLVCFAVGATGAMYLFRRRSSRIAAMLVLFANIAVDGWREMCTSRSQPFSLQS